jgi:hypothetical protein
MSTVGLFLVGTGVTLLVAAALGLLLWAAVLDGRDEQAFRRESAPIRDEDETLATVPAA